MGPEVFHELRRSGRQLDCVGGLGVQPQPKMTDLAANGRLRHGGLLAFGVPATFWPSGRHHVEASAGTGPRSEVKLSRGTAGRHQRLFRHARATYRMPFPGMGFTSRRVVADVAFNADPATGQYTAVMQRPGAPRSNRLMSGGRYQPADAPVGRSRVAVANGEPRAGIQSGTGPALTPPSTANWPLCRHLTRALSPTLPGAAMEPAAHVHRRWDTSRLSGLGTPNATSLANSLTGTNASAAAGRTFGSR